MPLTHLTRAHQSTASYSKCWAVSDCVSIPYSQDNHQREASWKTAEEGSWLLWEKGAPGGRRGHQKAPLAPLLDVHGAPQVPLSAVFILPPLPEEHSAPAPSLAAPAQGHYAHYQHHD